MAEVQMLDGGLYVYTTPLETLNWSNHIFFETKKLGVVVYDVPVLNKDGKALWEQIKKYTSGNISQFIISHGHPDHWGSLDFFREVAPKAPILMAKMTADYIHVMGEANVRWCLMTDNLAAETFTRVIEPTDTFEKEKVIDAGDFTLQLYATGPADDMEHTIVYIPELKILLGNDVIYNKWHPWNDLERDGHWLRIIDWMRDKFDAKTIVPGHGPICGPEIYDSMEKWLTLFQDLRLKYGGRYSLKDMAFDERRKMMDELKAAFPDWYDYELDFSCFQTMALPYPYSENKYSMEKF
jgi:cyclase